MSVKILIEGLLGHGRKGFEGRFMVMVSPFLDFTEWRDGSGWSIDVCLSGSDLVTESNIFDVLWPVQKSEKAFSLVFGVFAANCD